MKKSIGKYDNQDMFLTIANYRNNGRIYIALENEDSDLYADVTINLSDMLLPDDDYKFPDVVFKENENNEVQPKELTLVVMLQGYRL